MRRDEILPVYAFRNCYHSVITKHLFAALFVGHCANLRKMHLKRFITSLFGSVLLLRLCRLASCLKKFVHCYFYFYAFFESLFAYCLFSTQNALSYFSSCISPVNKCYRLAIERRRYH